jgi:hypothetical protein
MHAVNCRVARLLFVLTLLPLPVFAQDWSQPWADPMDRPARVDVTGSMGFVMPSNWSKLVLLGSISSGSGVFEQVLARDLRVEPDKAFGAAVTYWRARYGFRVQTDFSRSFLRIGASPLGASQLSIGDGQAESVRVKTWLYDMRGVIGLVEYEPRRLAWPYAFFGVGGITYDLARTVSPPLTFIAQGVSGAGIVQGASGAGANIVITRDEGRQFVLSSDELGLKTVFSGNFGVGTDFRIPFGPAGVGVRLELSDRVAPSPLGLHIAELTRVGPSVEDRIRFGLVHHLSATAGFVVQLGR